jgi:hypothetical protein
VPFNPRIHDPEDEFRDKFTGERYARGQMTWLVEKGERLPEIQPKIASIEMCCKFRKTDDRDFNAVLVGCDDDEAPSRYQDNRRFT